MILPFCVSNSFPSSYGKGEFGTNSGSHRCLTESGNTYSLPGLSQTSFVIPKKALWLSLHNREKQKGFSIVPVRVFKNNYCKSVNVREARMGRSHGLSFIPVSSTGQEYHKQVGSIVAEEKVAQHNIPSSSINPSVFSLRVPHI